MTARGLLARAAAIYDAPGSPLRAEAAGAARRGFASGAGWMARALQALRGAPCPPVRVNFHLLGLTKYGLAGAAALASAAVLGRLRLPSLVLLSVVVFYAVEAQLVFLFPVGLDGSTRPFRQAWRLTRRAGGTVAVMRVVLPLAATMLCGGFGGRGFVRSWCLGCLAVCLWYEEVRARGAGGTADGRRFPLECGAFRPPLVRREQVRLGLERPLRLFYASDLHLGRRWTGRVPEQLLQAARETKPDWILLGGDLADHARALPVLRECVARLTAVAPVLAVAGNHDVRAGVAAVRDAVRSGGGCWLPDGPVAGPLRIDGVPDATPADRPRLLCAHFPDVFPAAAAAGYRVVLAGHLHGGQCVLATRDGILYPAAWFHRWHGLRFADRGAVMFVSRGVADSFPFRWNCPREVILCEIS